jgi:hypothetical protein
MSTRKSIGEARLKDLHVRIEAAQEKLNLVNRTCNIKYEELKEGCSKAQRLQIYIEQFKNSQEYQEIYQRKMVHS